MTTLHPARALGLPAAALLVAASPALAATCITGPLLGGAPSLVCNQPGTAPVASATDGLSVLVTPGASITSANRDTPPLALSGRDQSVFNGGLIENTDARNNTDAVQARGDGLLVENSGTIVSGDRAVHVLGGAADFTLVNREDGVIRSRRQAVRTEVETASPNGFVLNFGLIESTNGRAVQMRGTGSAVINHGTLIGGEEVIEGRLDFTVENHGLIAIGGLSWDPVTRSWTDSGAPMDEDGVQFSSGRIDNFGVILSTDDGVDIDEGVVHNHVTGVIISAAPDHIRDSGAVDIDPVLQIPGVPDALHPPAGFLKIVNEGYMEGPRAIVADLESTAPLEILNTGTLFGRSGIAIDLAPGQGDTTIALAGGSRVLGNILFGGGGENALILGPFETGATMQGTVSAQLPPLEVAALSGLFGTGLGAFDVLFDEGLGLSDFLRFLHRGERFVLDLRAGAGEIRFDLLGVNSFELDGARYDPSEFARFLSDNGVSVIPLPAAGWLLLGGLGALALLRRRRAA